MRSSRSLFCVALALMLLVSVGGAMAQEQEGAKWEPWGPHVDEIFMPIYSNYGSQISAFQRGELDVMPGMTGSGDVVRVKETPNTDIVTNYGFHMYYLCLNTKRAPLNADPLRQAIAHLVDRDRIVSEVLQGYVLPLAYFLPPSCAFHMNNLPAPAYDPGKAAEVLNSAGYKMDIATKTRRDPATGRPMREMRILAASSSVGPDIGRILEEACWSIGIPVKTAIVDFNTLVQRIDKRDFDMFLLATNMDQRGTSLYDFFHSSQDLAGSDNRSGIRDAELDRALETLYYALDLETARGAAGEAQLLLSKRVPLIPIYSRPHIDAFRSDRFTGYVPMDGEGAAKNMWTLLGIRPTSGTGGVLRWPLAAEPSTLNPCTLTTAYEREVLTKIIDSLMATDPVTLEDIPWMAREWEIGTWEPAKDKRGTVITWHLRDGILWQDGEPFTSADIKFTIEYLKKYKVPNFAKNVHDIVKVETPDRLTAKVYFSTESYWHLYNANLCFLPEHIWKSVWNYKTFSPWQQRHPKVKDLTRLIGTGPFILKEFSPGKHVRLVKNPLYWRLNPPDGAEN